MRLKKLILQGFKSFRNRTIIGFDQGITGIVGPNGGGKSNIMDALFWVMGEQSVRHLRGKIMSDLIFSGSDKYPASSFAEVSLVLDNFNNRPFHIANKVLSPSEIQLTRKLYRNGESEYRINGTLCRMKDIQEIFMDIGAGTKSYSIIAQGEIDRLINSRPSERRIIIEEVAGITKFKSRKKDSIRKLEKTKENLNYIEDLKVELLRSLEQLEKQTEKARRGKFLKENIRELDLKVTSQEVYSCLNDVRKNIINYNNLSLDLNSWIAKKSKLELDTQKKKIKIDELANKVNFLQQNLNEQSTNLALNKQGLDVTIKNIESKNKEIKNRENELEEINKLVFKLNEDLDKLYSQKEEISNNNSNESKISENRERLIFLQEDNKKINENLQDLNESIADKKISIEKNNKEVTEIDKELVKLNEDIKRIEKERLNLESEQENLLGKINELKADYKGIDNEINLENDSFLKLENQFKIYEHNKVDINSKLSLVRDLIEENKRATVSKTFLSDENHLDFSFIASIIEFDSQYRKVISSLLSILENFLICGSNSFTKVFNWFDENQTESLSTIYKSNYLEVDFVLDDKWGKITPIIDIIKIKESYKRRVASLLSGFYIVEKLNKNNLSELLSQLNKLSYKAISSLDGDIVIKNIHNQVVLEFNLKSFESKSIIAQESRVNEYLEVKEDLDQKLSDYKVKLGDKSEYMAKLINEKNELDRNIFEVKSNHLTLISKINILNNTIDSSYNRKKDLNKKKDRIIYDINFISKQYHESLSVRQNYIDKIRKNTNNIIRIENELNIYENKDNNFKEKVLLQSIRVQLEALNSQTSAMHSQLDREKIRLSNNQFIIEMSKKELNELELKANELSKLEIELSKKLEKLSSDLDYTRLEHGELAREVKDLSKEIYNLNSKISNAEKDLGYFKSSIKQSGDIEKIVVSDIFEKYNVNLRECVGNYVEFTDSEYSELDDISNVFFIEGENGLQKIEAIPYSFIKSDKTEIKNIKNILKNHKREFSRIGDINWQAIEEFDKQKKRYDFLSIEEEKLRKSYEDLQHTIDKIDDRSKEKFKDTFNTINNCFRRVFPVVFGGGEARLGIYGDFDDPECGIEVFAQPPGKNMKSMTLLSGGEKALTAIALIFGIFLIKPSPFCFLDEVDAPLDDANVIRFNELLKEISSKSQFVLITHNRNTMKLNNTLYGITMQEPGISNAVSVELQ